MVIEFTADEKELINTLAKMYHLMLPPDFNFSYEESEELRDAAMDFEVLHGLDENYNPTPEGDLAIIVADKLLAA